MVDLRLHLGDATELQVEVVPDVVQNVAALVQDLNDTVELGACHSAARACRYTRKRTDLSGNARHRRRGNPKWITCTKSRHPLADRGPDGRNIGCAGVLESYIVADAAMPGGQPKPGAVPGAVGTSGTTPADLDLRLLRQGNHCDGSAVRRPPRGWR